jgi:flavin reductase (DIM6/NTAB) family NADH-FMN oxidoreductase RutF
VAIVTAVDPELHPLGMTINSFSSISLEPALVAWCIDRASASYSAFSMVRQFRITVLSDDQQQLALRFATRGADKFRDIGWDAQGPIIEGGCARFECTVYRQLLLGDHLMIVGAIDRFDQSEANPLLFFDGQLAPKTADPAVIAA